MISIANAPWEVGFLSHLRPTSSPTSEYLARSRLEKMWDIVVVGSMMMDLVSTVERLPKVGETIHGISFEHNYGGKGANQCVAAASLGATTAMVGLVGEDSYGKKYLRHLRELEIGEGSTSGIDLEQVFQTSKAMTGIASIWVDGQGNNSIIITAGANSDLKVSDLKGADHLLKKAKMIVCQLEIPIETTLEVLRRAKEYGCRSIFNPAPAVKDLPAEFLSYSDILCANETEAELLCGFPVDTDDACQRALAFLLERGPNTAIITLGERGAVFATKDSPKTQFVTVDQVKVVDTTGAGDAFVGALAHFLVADPEGEGKLREAVRKACKYASLTVQFPGSQKSFPAIENMMADFFD
ncbi:hypothetical protein RvY_05777 [Ramazzottius varieornatus]|uniref:Ribokinase n=1 Tax=Ramazzottius varieornatus TaxID=947166 RepID=A0A1D1UW73_RAMVA|nr:hypothetical protein RvY_05777 [Ramazzottius varieornatus]